MEKMNLKIPPVGVFIITITAMWLIHMQTASIAYAIPYKNVFSILLLFPAFIFGVIAIKACKSAKTSIDPRKPDNASSLITHSIFSYSRNPMYFALFLMLLSYSIFLANPLSLGCLPLFVMYMNRFQIIPEEKVLLNKFETKYSEYTQKVGRWI